MAIANGTWWVDLIEHHPEPGHGALTVMNDLDALHGGAFRPKRLFWLTGLDPGMTRGGHAHKQQSQLFTVLRGGVTFSLYAQGQRHETIRLDRVVQQITLGPLVWVTLMEFAPDTIVLAMADGVYDELDYLRTWEDFLAYRVPEPTLPAEDPAPDSPTPERPRPRRTPRSATANVPP